MAERFVPRAKAPVADQHSPSAFPKPTRLREHLLRRLPLLPSPERNSSSLRVLLIEDHEDTARVLEKVLQQMGHEVETCSTVASHVRS